MNKVKTGMEAKKTKTKQKKKTKEPSQPNQTKKLYIPVPSGERTVCRVGQGTRGRVSSTEGLALVLPVTSKGTSDQTLGCCYHV